MATMYPEKKIGGRKFTFQTIPPVEAVRLEVTLAKVLGEPLFHLLAGAKLTGGKPPVALPEGVEPPQEGVKTSKGELDLDVPVITQAIALLVSKLDTDELLATLDLVFKSVRCDGKPVLMESTFLGRNKEVWLVFVEALKVNFADFFPDDLLGSVRAAVTAK